MFNILMHIRIGIDYERILVSLKINKNKIILFDVDVIEMVHSFIYANVGKLKQSNVKGNE